MEPTGLPHRVSQNPKDIANPKTAKETNSDEEWDEKINDARKVSLEATAEFEKANAKEPSTPNQNIRVFTAKIEELEALIRLRGLEAEGYSRQVESLKPTKPGDDEEIVRLLAQMRKGRKSSAELTKMSLALQSERATFLESTTDTTALTRSQLLGDILLEPMYKARGEGESRNRQSSWKQNLADFYNAGQPGSGVSSNKKGVQSTRYSWIWCPVSQVYLESPYIRASHIAPKSLGPRVLSYLTGTTSESTMLVGNGILLADLIKGQLDKGGIVIIPTGNIESPIELKLVIINEDLRNQNWSPYPPYQRWDALDGRILQFKNASRPNKRFLYLRYAMTMLYALRHKVAGYERLQSDIWPSRLIWASPDKYVRKSCLQSIGGLIGEHFDETFEDEEDCPQRSLVSQNLLAKFRAVVDTMPCDADSDSDDDSDDNSNDN
jgi:hypothetical protein